MGAPAVASYLGVTLRTVYAFIDEAQLPAYKVRRVRREDVDQYLERSRIKPGDVGAARRDGTVFARIRVA